MSELIVSESKIQNQEEFLEICDSLFSRINENIKTSLSRCLTPALAISYNRPFAKEISGALGNVYLENFFDQNFCSNKYASEIILLVLWKRSREEEVVLDELFNLWKSWSCEL